MNKNKKEKDSKKNSDKKKDNQFLNFNKKKGNSKDSVIISEANESDEEKENISGNKKSQSQSISDILSKKNSLKITKIVLDNFKSFEGKHEIGFFLDFSVVLGPNGSGKSNILDAICFALGMKTVSLRTKNLKDLIYKKEFEDDTKRTAYVEVYLIKDGEEIVFKRSISNKGSSDYYFAGKKLTAEEYLDKLEGFNIPSKARYFILVQGAIDTMLSKKNDLTETIEYLSGSYEFKEAYDLLKQEIQGLNNDINKLSSEMHNLKDDRNKVKSQIENEEKYNELVERLNRLLEKYFLYKLGELDIMIKTNEDNLNENEHSLKLIQDEKKEIIDFIKQTEIEIKKYESQLKQEENSDYSISKKKVDELKQKVLEVSEGIKLSENQIFSKISMLNQYKSEKKKKDEKIAILKTQMVSVQKIVDELRRKINFEVPEGKLNMTQITEYREISTKVEKDTFQVNKDIESLQQQMTENISKKALVEKNYSKIESELSSLESDLKSYSSKINKEEDTKKRLESEVVMLKKTISTKDSEKFALDAEFENLEKILQEKLQQLAFYESENQESQKRKKIAELIHKNSMVYGFLYELVTPLQKRLELPVKVSLLKYLGYLVVENEETAKVCSEFLKSKEISADVLVLENIPTREVDESTRLKLGHLGTLVVDLIDCSKKKGLKNAINYILKDLVLCTDKKNIPLLKSLGFTSIISLDGTLYKKGTIIGGVYKSLDQYSFNYKASNIDELEKLRKETEGLIKQLTGVGRKREDYKELNTLKHQAIEKENQLELTIKNIKLYNDSIERIRIQIDLKNQQLKQLEEAVSNTDTVINEFSREMETMNNRIQEVQTAYFRDFMTRHNLKSLRDFEAYSLNQIKKLSEELKLSEEKLVKLNSQIQILEANDELIAKLEVQIAEDKEKRKTLEKEKAERDVELLEANRTFDQISQAKSQQDQKHEGMIQEIKNKQGELERIDKRLRGLLKNKIEFRHNVNEFIEKKIFFIEDTKINLENYLKELTTGSVMSITFNIDLNKFIVANENIGGKNNVVIDYSTVESKVKVTDRTADTIAEKLENVKIKFTTDINEIEKYVKLVSLNESESDILKDKEDELNQKKKNLSLQVQTLINDLEVKKAELEKVHNKRRSKFDSFFKKMSDKLITVYRELTKPQDSSNPGGSAYIYATNEDEPYLGSICYLPTPPGKRVIYDIDQLSGGEKTIAILSLVIALQTICETPFIILDEIDSYLDPEHELILENLFQRHNKLFQIILVTHKSNIFRSAQALIGTYFNKSKFSSIPISVDMTKI
jgi:structural maintenance of chromosome 1